MKNRWAIAMAAATLGLLVADGCRESSSPGLPVGPTVEIVDGASLGGNAHFFFLPPLRPLPTFNGAFDGTLAPTVEICVLAQCGTSALVTYSLSTGDGSELLRVDPATEQYIVNWHTDRFALDPAITYRIRVLVDGRLLGYADVDVVSRGADLKRVDTGEFIPLLDGRTLPIKFRIEQGALPPASASITPTSGPPGSTFTIYDPLGRMQPGDWVLFYLEGTDPALGNAASNVQVSSDGRVLTGTVPGACQLQSPHYVTVRPGISGIARFADLPYLCTA